MSVRRIHRDSVRFRSTKSASKARRDLINHEIQNMKKLLPIHLNDQQRLSYLHAMSVSCVFIRKSVRLPGSRCSSPRLSVPNESVLPALPGFLLSFLKDGKLLCVSENIQEYLGYSMVDVLQNDSFFQLLDSGDQERVRGILEHFEPPLDSFSFVCQLRSARGHRIQNGTSSVSVVLKGRMQNGVCVCLCSPTADRVTDAMEYTNCFHTQHSADMRITLAQYSVLFHLGFSEDKLIGRSWYELLHPDDLKHAADRHSSLVRSGGESEVQILVRMQCKDLSWSWIYIRAAMNPETHSISCRNHLISEMEAQYLRQKLLSDDENKCTEGDPLYFESQRDSWISETQVDLWVSDSSSEAENHSSSSFNSPPCSTTSSDFLSDGLTAFEKLVNNSQFCPTLDSSAGGAPAIVPTVAPEPFLKPHLVPEAFVESYPDSFPEAHMVLEPFLMTPLNAVPKIIPENPFLPTLESFPEQFPDVPLIPVQLFMEPEPQHLPEPKPLLEMFSEPCLVPVSQLFQESFSEPFPQWSSQQTLVPPQTLSDFGLRTELNVFPMSNPDPRLLYNSPDSGQMSSLAQQINTLANSFRVYNTNRHTNLPLSSALC